MQRIWTITTSLNSWMADVLSAAEETNGTDNGTPHRYSAKFLYDPIPVATNALRPWNQGVNAESFP